MIKTIIFDIGGVLIHFDHKKICRKLERYSEYSKEEIYKMIFKSNLIEKYDTGKISNPEFNREAHKIINSTNRKIAIDWHDTYRKNLDVNKLVLKLKNNGYRLLILSNTDKLSFNFLKKKFREITKPFDGFILSYKIRHRKPERKIFEEAIKLSRCNPDEIIFIDDKKENIEVANKLGINGIHFQNIVRLKKDLIKLGVKI